MKLELRNKFYKLSTIILTFFICIVTVNAASDRIEIISAAGGIVNLGENGGQITKTIVASDTEKGEITIEVKISNARLTEIIFVIDNSTEMEALETVKSTIINSTKTMVTNLHTNLNNIKTGLFAVHPYGTTPTTPTNGGLLSEISADETDTLDALDDLGTASGENGQDFVAVMNAANDSFSEEAENKVIVLITSGIDSTNIETYKDVLTDIGNDAEIITLVVENDEVYVEEMFGTEVSPTTGILYDIDEADINDTLTADAYSDLIDLLPDDKFGVLLEDVFPDSIFENFTIEYVGSPSHGTVEELNETDKSFTWNVGNLEDNKIATFRYKLTLNDQVPASIKDILLNINESIYFEYSDSESNDYNDTYQCSPIIKILISNPKTGLYDLFIPATIFFSISVLLIAIIKRKEIFLQI